MNAENFVAFFLKERGWEDWQGEEKSDILKLCLTRMNLTLTNTSYVDYG